MRGLRSGIPAAETVTSQRLWSVSHEIPSDLDQYIAVWMAVLVPMPKELLRIFIWAASAVNVALAAVRASIDDPPMTIQAGFGEGILLFHARDYASSEESVGH
jgi:hypothetical protein